MTTAPAITTGTADDAQGRFARDALRSQRQRLSELFRGFDDETWTAPTRCTEWCVHEVVRHLCDITVKWVALLRGEPLEQAGFQGFDPRTTPAEWVERSATERPVDTIGLFEQASTELLDEVDRLAESNATDTVRFVFGTVPWSALVLHGFWDAWVHERDILVPLGRAHESPEIESRAAAQYGLTVSSLPFALFGTPFEETVVLDGSGGGVFHLDVREGIATTSVGGGQEGALRGALPEVVDSLIGRGLQPSDVLHGPPERAEALGKLRQFMLLPAL